MGFFYSHGLGLVENESAEYETEDDAMIAYYKLMISCLLEQRESIEKQLRANEAALTDLHEEYTHLKEKYPEEFI